MRGAAANPDAAAGVEMRSIGIAFGGVALALGMWGHSTVIGGLGGASLYMLSLFVAPIAVALAIANSPRRGFNSRLAFSSDSRALPRPARRQGRSRSRCRGCGRSRQLSSDVWICSRCDVGESVSEL